jgi:hypothetical protein
MATVFAAWPRRRVDLVELWRILDDADSLSSTQHGRRVILADALTELERAELLELAAKGSWDRSQKPHLPKFVTLPKAEPRPPAKRIIWHHRLSWVPDVRVTSAQRAHLVRLNTWLHQHYRQDLPVIPHRERSVKIFGNEKILDKLMTTSLFAEDRLCLSMLGARRVAPRFTFEIVSSGDRLLIVENSDTFDSLVMALTGRPGRVGIVGWGAGGGFEQSVLSIPRLGRPIHDVRYFGDFDAKGLQIPSNANVLAGAEGLPPIQPASGLYKALFLHATPQPSEPRLAAGAAGDLVAWLPEEHRLSGVDHLVNGNRLAQEEVGITELTAEDGWREDLG